MSAAIETALGGKSDDLIATLRREIENRRQSGEIRLGRRRWPLELTDGVVRLKPLQLEAEAPRVSASARVDLATFALEAEWRVEPAPAQPVAGATAKAPLPGVVFAYTGTAGRAAALSPQLNMQALERELAVRKLERDVDELERLRRLDEQRARAETERRNAEAAALQRERDQRLGGQPSEPPAAPPPATPTPAPGPANATPADRQRLFGTGGG